MSTSTTPSATDRTPRPRVASARHHHIGFWLVAGSFFFLMLFGTAPTPMWPLFAAEQSWSPTQVTAAFAVLVVGAASGLFFLGHLSDRFGRRRLIAPALAVAITADVQMALWHTFGGMLVGRVLTGLAIGLMASTGTTYLVDLYGVAKGSASNVPTTVASAANLGGLSVGPLVGGALVQWGPGGPFVTPFLVLAAFHVVALIAVLSTPETIDRFVARATLQKKGFASRIGFREGRRGLFAAGAAVAAATFAINGTFASVGALIVRGELHVTQPFVWGVAAFMTLGASAAVQLLIPNWPPRPSLAVGICFLPVGITVVILAVHNPSLAVYLTGAALMGIGGGLLFKVGLTAAVMAADPAVRAGTLSVFFVVAYLGMGIPPVLLGIAQTYWSVTASLIVFGAVTFSICATAAVFVSRHLKGKSA